MLPLVPVLVCVDAPTVTMVWQLLMRPVGLATLITYVAVVVAYTCCDPFIGTGPIPTNVALDVFAVVQFNVVLPPEESVEGLALTVQLAYGEFDVSVLVVV